jgi:hypothetical protein
MDEVTRAVDAAEIAGRIAAGSTLESVYADSVKGRHLRCLECGRTEPASAEYFKIGWPKCHGATMRLEVTDG